MKLKDSNYIDISILKTLLQNNYNNIVESKDGNYTIFDINNLITIQKTNNSDIYIYGSIYEIESFIENFILILQENCGYFGSTEIC